MSNQSRGYKLFVYLRPNINFLSIFNVTIIFYNFITSSNSLENPSSGVTLTQTLLPSCFLTRTINLRLIYPHREERIQMDNSHLTKEHAKAIFLDNLHWECTYSCADQKIFEISSRWGHPVEACKVAARIYLCGRELRGEVRYLRVSRWETLPRLCSMRTAIPFASADRWVVSNPRTRYHALFVSMHRPRSSFPINDIINASTAAVAGSLRFYKYFETIETRSEW